MASSHVSLFFSFFFFFLLFFAWVSHPSHALTTFRFDVHHRYSDPVKHWAAERAGANFLPDEWPRKGTVDYYAALADHDRILHRRRLASNGDGSDNQTLTFYDGNATVRINSLGFLHYAAVSLGTPNMTFLVALDTGSDVFWVPCDCRQCAPTASTAYGFDFELNIYSPNRSSTSKKVPCNNELCQARDECAGAGSSCPYKVAYVSADTSSSGILVEDVMYLTTEHDNKKVDARVVFGCGQFQSGSFLSTAAPNGLFGLGMEKISVPSILANAGLTADSFSMCFGEDGIGRIVFGDKGSPDQGETPFNFKQSHPTYNVSVTGLRVGTDLIDTNFSAITDSGTSFTYLADPAYTRLSESFNSQAHDNRHSPDARIPFEYCYYMSPNANGSLIPSISLTMERGGQFSVFNPILIISVQTELIYCLAVAKSRNLNIIGQNFMTGNKIVFDREKSILGWKKFDCYDVEDSNTLPVKPRNATARDAMPPAAVTPNSYTPEATKQSGNDRQVTVLPIPPLINQSPHLSLCSRRAPLMLSLLLFIIVW